MENSTFFKAYIMTTGLCVLITIILLLLIHKGSRSFFEKLCQDQEIARFFTKLTMIIILVGGLGAALSASYNTDEKSNWLTLTWDIGDQFESLFDRFLLVLMILSGVFFILQMLLRVSKK